MKVNLIRNMAYVTLMLCPFMLSADLSDGIESSINRVLLFLLSVALLITQLVLYFKKKPGQIDLTAFLFICCAAIIFCSIKMGTDYRETYYYNLPTETTNNNDLPNDWDDHATVEGELILRDSTKIETNKLAERAYIKSLNTDYYTKLGYCWIIVIISIATCAHAVFIDVKLKHQKD